MKKAILIYYSRTGFTEQYVRWLAEMTGCPAASYKDARKMELEPYDVVIFASHFRAGYIQKLRWLRKGELRRKQKIILATGAAPIGSPEAKRQIAVSIRDEGLKCPVFYLESGINYEAMDRGEKLMMELFRRLMSEQESENFLHSHDNSSREYLQPVVRYMRELGVAAE
ncbi:MAG TPA: hypothetical protein IAB34_12465 [Candidatus Egerieimonas faecigallinarum]|nr:hypothetical protein [Candidatus Egerieimonas faecigallinarum]